MHIHNIQFGFAQIGQSTPFFRFFQNHVISDLYKVNIFRQNVTPSNDLVSAGLWLIVSKSLFFSVNKNLFLIAFVVCILNNNGNKTTITESRNF